MKLLRFQDGSKVCLGALEGETIIALDSISQDYPTMLSIIAGGEAALARVREVVARRERAVPLVDVRLLAPLERPGKFLAIGMNYRKHIAESERLGVPKPQQQYWFNKQTSCISGPFDDIVTSVTEKLDYEVELAAVIGLPAKGVDAQNAHQHVFGYTVCNDVSARDWQFHSPTFTMGKSLTSSSRRRRSATSRRSSATSMQDVEVETLPGVILGHKQHPGAVGRLLRAGRQVSRWSPRPTCPS
jgi:2-keto-4-pentenoate hydratase/2-oxohepta-3-ene-1,7-dioic acid hydratase in catechol pathway